MPDSLNKARRYLAFAAFNATQAVLLSPLLFFAPAILGRAALYTAGIIGGLSWVGATAKEDKYLYIGGPLMAGLAVVVLSSLAPMILPASVRSLLASH
jgi:growth hormone-inducible transmembrane protein